MFFLNVSKRDPKAQTEIKDISYKYNKLPIIDQSKMGSDTLIQTVILKERINLMGTTIVDIEIELKMKISRMEHLESLKHI